MASRGSRLVCLPVAAALLVGACGGDDNLAPTDTRRYDADDPNIQYAGRIDFANAKQPAFALGATSITAAFRGIGVAVLLEDEHRYGLWRNYYDAIVDGVVVAKIRPDDDPTIISYPVASNLPYGDHVVTIVKRTEANVGVGFFDGFDVAGVLRPPPARPARKMLFFGDSITAGSGVEATDGDPACSADGWGQPVQNADASYGPDAARPLGAESHVFGVAGIGLVRNWESDPAKADTRPLPQVYDFVYPERSGADMAIWPPSYYLPDAIVVALGTNDFSPGPLNPDNTPVDGRAMMDAATFATAYVAFIDTLRADYPAAHVFMMGSPMLIDGWPTAAYKSKSGLDAAINLVEEHYATAGDAKVHAVFVSRQGGGCAAHPNVTGQQATGMELAAAVQAALGW
jgi:lysophospholipase L1-like esterase